jgi:hypothetical protein
MTFDIVIPDGNEKEFEKNAKKLGIDTLIFLYDKAPKDSKRKVGIITDKKIKTKHLVFSRGNERDRWIFEKQKPNVVFDLEFESKKDKTHFRNSGLDQVLGKLAFKNDIMIGFNFSKLLKSSKKGIILGRIMQNIKICEKYKTKYFMASFAKDPSEMRSPFDLKCLLLCLKARKVDLELFS